MIGELWKGHLGQGGEGRDVVSGGIAHADGDGFTGSKYSHTHFHIKSVNKL